MSNLITCYEWVCLNIQVQEIKGARLPMEEINATSEDELMKKNLKVSFKGIEPGSKEGEMSNSNWFAAFGDNAKYLVRLLKRGILENGSIFPVIEAEQEMYGKKNDISQEHKDALYNILKCYGNANNMISSLVYNYKQSYTIVRMPLLPYKRKKDVTGMVVKNMPEVQSPKAVDIENNVVKDLDSIEAWILE